MCEGFDFRVESRVGDRDFVWNKGKVDFLDGEVLVNNRCKVM